MPYVTIDYYNGVYKGESVSNADFPSLCKRAEEIIEEMTMYRLTLPMFNEMPEEEQERVKSAICAQIEYLDANGGADMDNGANLQSAGLGKFSYSRAGTNDNSIQSFYSPRAKRLLFSTGLLHRGGRCL